MVFSSLIFAFLFLPIVLFLYYLANEKYKNYILLAASLIFYSYGEPQFVFVMIGSILINYFLAILIDRNRGQLRARILMWVDAVINIGILFVYKYLDYSLELTGSLFGTGIEPIGIVLPIGISFFTFQALSYVIDVYRGTVSVQKNPLYVALYISFFPQLIAGPIVRYSTIEKQISHRVCKLELFSEGARRFMIGFGKKIILANNLAFIPEVTFGRDVTETNPLFLWMGAICYSLQIFYDFSGYSDMAIGLGKMFGFEFEENFNYPYISKSITEFWRRWHISLSSWFRDYVYIPLGGSRVKPLRHVLNMLVVWALTGIWHGANVTFLMWGIGYFVLLTFEKYVIKPSEKKSLLFETLWRIFTLVCVNFGWVIFNSSELGLGIRYCLAMVGRYRYSSNMLDSDVLSNMRQYGVFIVLGVLFATPLVKVIKDKMSANKIGDVLLFVEPCVVAAVFVWAISYLILGAHNPFIYFNF